MSHPGQAVIMSQQACRPSSVSFRGRTVTINLVLPLPTGSSSQPEGLGRAPLTPSYLALLRAGFSRPPGHPGAGGLLPHHFTLTPTSRGGMFLCHFPSGYPAWELPSALPVWSSDLPPSAEADGGHPACWNASIIPPRDCALIPVTAVQRQVRQLVRPFVPLARDVLHREPLKLPAQLQYPVEEG